VESASRFFDLGTAEFLPTSFMIDIESFFADRLSQKINISYPPQESGIKTSAVLVPLIKDEGVWKILYTRRSDEVNDHRGQISFPGGRVEAGDAGPLETALREAREELGIRSEDVRPLGILDPAETRTGFRIWPVAGVLQWPIELILSRPEVHEVFFVPVDWLTQPGNFYFRQVESADGTPQSREPIFKPFGGNVIWGATAAITARLMDLLGEERAK
jgi:8-oxo-dGTP pyrophosphatase MutT (NUDIX family)